MEHCYQNMHSRETAEPTFFRPDCALMPPSCWDLNFKGSSFRRNEVFIYYCYFNQRGKMAKIGFH